MPKSITKTVRGNSINIAEIRDSNKVTGNTAIQVFLTNIGIDIKLNKTHA